MSKLLFETTTTDGNCGTNDRPESIFFFRLLVALFLKHFTYLVYLYNKGKKVLIYVYHMTTQTYLVSVFKFIAIWQSTLTIIRSG